MNKYFDYLSNRESVDEIKNLILETFDNFNNNSIREFYNNIRKNTLFYDNKISILSINIEESKINFWYKNIKNINSFYLETIYFHIDVKNRKCHLQELCIETDFGCIDISENLFTYSLKNNNPDYTYHDVIAIEFLNNRFKTFDMSDFFEYDFSIKYTEKINYLDEKYKEYKLKISSTLKELSFIANVDAEVFLDFIIFNKSIPQNIIDICEIKNDVIINLNLSFAKELKLRSNLNNNNIQFSI